jgi:hypothetical protein
VLERCGFRAVYEDRAILTLPALLALAVGLRRLLREESYVTIGESHRMEGCARILTLTK